jgi:glutamate-1-semialdehyde 2,1-aminomutase
MASTPDPAGHPIHEERRGQGLYKRAKELIPGGTQLLTKRPELHLPEHWPSYFRNAHGAMLIDLDGNRYLDMSYSAVGACILGYADPDVNDAVKHAIDSGTACTLNCPEEIELAELLLEIHPWAERARFARGGGEAMAIAVRIARAATGRDKIAFCGYHGWHDWYLAANLGSDALDGHLLPGLDPAGVPLGLAGSALPFHYNRLEELSAILDENPGEIAAIVMEPIRDAEPRPEFLHGVRQAATGAGAALVFDEITSGLRLNHGGAHLEYGVEPDVAVFAKGLGNGYPIAAVIGRDGVMDAAQGTFISSTNWTERVGPVAALATLRKHRERHVAHHLARIGEQVREAWSGSAKAHGLNIEIGGIPPLSRFTFLHPEAEKMRTVYTQLMLDHDILATKAFYAMYSHSDEDLRRYLSATFEAFGAIAAALKENRLDGLLRGPVAQSGFKRLA